MIVRGYIGPIHARDLRLRSLADLAPEPTPNLELWYPQRMSEPELLAFCLAVCDGDVLLGHAVQPFEDVTAVFSGLSFLHEVTEEARRQVGAFYEYRALASGTTPHGNPHFDSVKFVHRDDWLRARDVIAAELVRRARLDD